MMKYKMVEPFDIDDGQLDGLSVQESFCLGVEWQMFRNKVEEDSGSFDYQIHSKNVDRLKALCNRHGRACTTMTVA